MDKMITVFKDKSPSLKEVQTLVGGYVERIMIPNSRDQMYVDENGLYKDLSLNIEASKLVGSPIVGHAVILKGEAIWT